MIQLVDVLIAGRCAGPVIVAITSAGAVPSVLSSFTTPVLVGCPHCTPVFPGEGPFHCTPVVTCSEASSTYQSWPAAGVPLRVGAMDAHAAFAGATNVLLTCVHVVADTDTVALDVDSKVLLTLYQDT